MRTPETLIHAGRFLRETFRDPVLLALTGALALFLMGLSAVGYPRTPYPPTVVIVIARAAGDPGLALGTDLAALKTADGRPAARVEYRDLPATGSLSPRAALTPGADLEVRWGARPDLRLDALSVSGVRAQNLVSRALNPTAGADSPLPVPLPRNDFEAFTPGMMVFAMLMMIPMTTVILGRERRQGTARRLKLAGLRSAPYLAGLAVSQCVSAVVLGAVLLLTAGASGFPLGPDGGMLAFGVLVGLCLGSVAQGLLVGAFVQDDASALILGQTAGMVQVVLTGSFFTMPAPIVADAGPGLVFRAWDFLPATHGKEALSLVLAGQGAEALGPGVWTLVWAAVWFALAVMVRRSKLP